ncbi:MAG: histidinol dehydrogenase [Eubacterium sp.]|jgi:histidinol dehydrogenase|uniref:histidinol dehydrogenase n=1 Tax=Eubacterium sp. F2 TaxID=3381348 RepID=UPI003907F48A|nr:histidinol dehydrogenase [Eubacterium sp.]MCI2196682.1 histidinol dehydrogenase [Eubacterium sp.]
MKIIKESKQRTAQDRRAVRTAVSDIIDDVIENGDDALQKYCRKFDDNNREDFRVTKEEIQEAYDAVSEQELSDLKAAHANIQAFAAAQRKTLTEVHDFSPREGIYLSDRVIPVRSCLCYVPGGRFPLYSSALMLITPAKEAGVRRIVSCSPAIRGTGKINPKTLVAMDLAGADEIYAVSGAQAIAAFSYGTENIKPVDMIVGPGNQYVAEAKRQCYGQVGIDFVAGPSEVLVVADKNARPDVLAADLMAQSEHDPNAKGILLTDSEELGRAVMKYVDEELKILPEANRANASASWQDYGEIRVLDKLEDAVEIANEIAPEHLEINVADPEAIHEKFVNYGSMFIGGNTAEVFGDYASGTNHTLPTMRAARYTGGVWTGMFLKVCTHQSMTREASQKIAPLTARMARGEGLEGHAIAADKRKA